MRKTILLLLLSAALISACSQAAAIPTDAVTAPRTLTIMTHDSFAISEPLITAFETRHGAKLQFLKAGDTGTALNKAILSKTSPLADVFYGVDNTFLSRALDEDIFIPYSSPALNSIPDHFKLDPQQRALPVDYGDVCLNYDKSYFMVRGLSPPGTLEDLLKPEYEGLLVVQNPATSSPGLAFLFATIGHFGPQAYLDYWQGLVENDVLVVNDWETAYYSDFSGSSGAGPRPVVVSYNSSPAFEVIYAETVLKEPPTAAVVSDETCFRQIEFVGILQGSQNIGLAQAWIDYMLSVPFQEDMPLQMFVFPVNSQAGLDEAFTSFLQVPERTSTIDPEAIAANREKWINAWTETVLR